MFKERIEMVPKDYQTLGKFVELKDDKGQMKPFFVSKIDKKFIYLDGNHYTGHVNKEIEKFSKITNLIAGHDCMHIAYSLFKQYKNKKHT